MAWFRRTAHDPEELTRIKSDIQVLRNTLEAHDRRRREAAVPEPAPAAAPEAGAEAAMVNDELHAALDAARAAQDTAAARLDDLATKLGELDARVTAVSTELANQVTELGHDIEALAARPAGDGRVDEAALGEIRDGQARLANEQARYQISFREDLARLAEQLRRPT